MDIHSRIQASKAQHTTLITTLSEYSTAHAALNQHLQHIADLESWISVAAKSLNTLSSKTAQHKSALDKLSNSRTRKLFKSKSDAETKVAAAESQYAEAASEEEAAKERLAGLRSELEAAKAKTEELQARCAEYDDAQKNLDDLYDHVFEGPTPEYPEEDSLELPYMDARLAHEEACAKYSGLVAARKLLDEAAGLLTKARGDIDAVPPIYHTLDREAEILDELRAMPLRAQDCIDKAKALCDTLRQLHDIDTKVVDRYWFGVGLMDHGFRGILLKWRDELVEGGEKFGALVGHVKKVLEEAGRVREDTERNLKEREEKLRAVRKRIFEVEGVMPPEYSERAV